MANAIALRRGGLSRTDRSRLNLFRRTIGKNLNESEIDEAIDWCEVYGANPFAKDIYFFVFDEDKPDKRRMVPVLGIGMYRKIAARTGNYRPDEEPPKFTYDESKKGPANPAGIVDCTVTIWMHSHGAWHPIRERLRWEERAPLITEEWRETGERWESGKPKRAKVQLEHPILDPKKQNWHTMPETMLAKTVEAAAIRKAWPEETAGSYVDGELDTVTIDLTASEIIRETEVEERQARLGGPSIQFDFCDGEPLQSIPIGKVHDRIMAFVEQCEKDKNTDKVRLFADRNVAGMRAYWAQDAAAALDLKKALEQFKREEVE